MKIDQSRGIPGAGNRNEALTTMMFTRSTFLVSSQPPRGFRAQFSQAAFLEPGTGYFCSCQPTIRKRPTRRQL